MTDAFVVVAGEFRTRDVTTFESARSRAADLARGVLRDAGYADAAHGIDPDGKSQASIRHRDGSPVAVETVVASTQHADGTPAEVIRRTVEEPIVEHVIPPALRGPAFRVLVNPTGAFVVGGPKADAGLTGRKNVVDTHGGSCATHGGEALSGKDPSKVGRSAAYAARHVAKNVVGAGLARRCTVQVAYAIGVADPDPVSLLRDTHGTGSAPDEVLEALVARSFGLTPGGITRDLNRPHLPQDRCLRPGGARGS